MNSCRFCQALLSCLILGLLTACRKPSTPQAVITPTSISIGASNWEEQFLLPNQWDGGLFSEEPCQAPCFAGIIPGITVESELVDIIEDNERFQGCELEDRPNQGRWVSCNGLIITINKTNSTVDGVGFKTSQQFSLEDVMSKYGEPTLTSVIPIGIPEAPEIAMVVFWLAT